VRTASDTRCRRGLRPVTPLPGPHLAASAPEAIIEPVRVGGNE